MAPSDSEWFDKAAGPIVRPYAMTRGRTRPRETDFDLIATVVSAQAKAPDDAELGPEHASILELCLRPLSVAEVASQLDLPLGVVRVLLSDLLDHGLVSVHRPASSTRLPSERVLEEVIDGLHAL